METWKVTTRSTNSVGPTAWKSGTVAAMEESDGVVRRAGKMVEIGRRTDPLPTLRDVLADLSNEQARIYFRQIGQVVHLLRDTLIDVNAEIKALTRSKETLDRALAGVKRDLVVNKESQQMRVRRPAAEKVCRKERVADREMIEGFSSFGFQIANDSVVRLVLVRKGFFRGYLVATSHRQPSAGGVFQLPKHLV